ncbi:subtilisin-like protein [Xylaria curta]|nr:subtilisin-like protein [Xylaria curta]
MIRGTQLLLDCICVAILDTGVDPSDRMVKAALRNGIRDRPRLLLKMAPSAEIFIGKIWEGKHLDGSLMSSITKYFWGVDYAVTEWDIDIISLSFDRALKADKLLFATASNEGGNRDRSRSARSSSVICIHACDGKGNKGLMNPNPEKRALNLSALGVAVESKWEGQAVYKLGTSFATPIAAGIAANVLEFASYRCHLLPGNTKWLKRHEGMCAILAEMSFKHVARDIQDIIKGL